MKGLILCSILVLFICENACANVTVSNTTDSINNNVTVNRLNESNSSESGHLTPSADVTSDDHQEVSKPDLFGRRFINFLSRRQSKVKVSRSETIKAKYIKFAQSIKDTTDDLLSTFLPVILRSLSNVEFSETCSGQVFRVIQGLYNQQTWAFKLIDSSGRLLPPGLLSGTTSDLGDYQQCLDIESLSPFDDHHFSPSSSSFEKREAENDDDDSINGDHFSDEGSLRPSSSHSSEVEVTDEVIFVTSNQRAQFTSRLQGQYCLLSFNPLLPIQGQESDGLNKRIQYLMAQYTDTLGIKNKTVETQILGYISNHLKKFANLTKLKTGICVPSGCDVFEVKSVINHIINELELPVTDISLGSECWTKDSEKSIDTKQLIAMSILSLTLLFVVTGTIVDVFKIEINRRGVPSVPHLILICFSIRRNLRKLTYHNYVPRNLISSKEDTSSKFSSLHGIRVLTMIWLIVTNTFIFGVIYKIFWIYRDGDKILHSMDSDWVQFIFHGWTAISDVYFSLSGFILTSNLLIILEESKGKLNFIDLITHRIIRLTPMIIGSTCLFILLPLTSSGPVFNEFASEQLNSCSSYWTNFLFISNWFPMEKLCIPSGWYFAVDFQLYLLAPLIIFIVHKSHQLGHKVLLIVIGSYVIISTIFSYLFDLTPVLTKAHFLDHEHLTRFIQVSLFPTYQHLIPFLAGILASSHVHRQSYRKVSQVAKLFILILLSVMNGSLTLLLPTLSGWNRITHPGDLDPSTLSVESGYDDGRIPFIALISGQLMKPLRAVLIVWILICFTSKGNFMFKNLLSHKKFIILSRLSPTFCLINFIPILWRAYSVTSVKDFTLFGLATDSMVNMIYSLILALGVYLMFESPFIQFEKGFKKRVEKNEITKLRSLRPVTDDKRLADVVC